MTIDVAHTYTEPDIAVPRSFNFSSFRQEWIGRRTKLISSWSAPVLTLHGAHEPHNSVAVIRAFPDSVAG